MTYYIHCPGSASRQDWSRPFANVDDARQEAARLATQHVAKRFEVVEVIAVCLAEQPVVTWLPPEPDEPGPTGADFKRLADHVAALPGVDIHDGAACFRAGICSECNPHRQDSTAHRQWLAAWMAEQDKTVRPTREEDAA